ncbi:hypothetical protein G8O24_31065 [Bradyrhizobium sp. INPA01-394B]|uniref:Uncharacterized protein n=1 Tax=Bradyrhizobium campsiandrae TaxID=1729892 RepID=A0ABR7UJY7_9BRAD|nr:hypothetical protein [Bradyrhizobium campsiandrae]MBC9881771.1 hypothetical protein [Bradyrhizobium campsiandrae]MBC9984425.1 hypothetical protein [Bradyrhizobium campsiandrae]
MKIYGTQYTGFSPGNTLKPAISGAEGRPPPSRETHSLTKIKSRVLSPVAQVPALHPYFAALLRQRQECETMACHRF